MAQFLIPNVVAQTPRGDRVMDVYSHLLAERVIYLGTPLDSDVANSLVAQLLYLDAQGGDRDIQLYINCEGGDPSAMLAVYDTMRFIRSDVATFCMGQAVSVGAVLLAAGAKGKRAALPHSRIVLHQPAAQGRGAIPDLILQADEIVRVRSELERILVAHTGRAAEDLRSDTDRDLVLTADAARTYGIVDEVIAERRELVP
ncbi:ATP-dependent Clp protease proteolytic subunit [Microbacterium resistens]|uniref:ATP-dependent Clp protease proteolytic subunit n=1 Tax=Microbacterium resistens TaxID=156977 RepID=A0ABY3RUY5_9MICO|nr:ATP-dependent Clp protease proteolytic subunit [Microbacterium resistens]MBW1639129.1 ATP-dependent Clp protease proteolytic subunit [Microbacterium resistens]UGS27864.1 ATP-dependent Clp protease proteolytic subunit [Microbacterium resistens]